jgi:polyhydroxyalkanoate synthesis regulator phasin
MFYYNEENKGEYTNNEKLAKLMVKEGKWKEYIKSDEPFIMQTDGSGYVKKSRYVEPQKNNTPTIEERLETLEKQVARLLNNEK